MRIPDHWLNSVFFLAVGRVGSDGATRLTYAGTGFYVRVANEWDPNLHRLYFATARHCIEQSQLVPGELQVRVNTEDGGALATEISKSDWTFHRDESIDLAVLAPRFEPTADRRLEHTFIEADACATPQVIDDFDIGVGSDV